MVTPMGKTDHHNRWRERNVARDRVHRRSATAAFAVGRVELQQGVLVAIDLAGDVVGRFATWAEASRALQTIAPVND
jgi:hypothetical protein